MAVKHDRAFFTELAIKEYNKRMAPQPEQRDYTQEAANAVVQEAVKASYIREAAAKSKSKFIKESKDLMLAECIYKIFNESLQSILSEEENAMVSEDLKKAVVFNFIKENGGTNAMLDKFYMTNTLLSEIAKFVDHYHSIITTEACKKDGGRCMADDGYTYQIPSDVEDNFYKDLNQADFGDVTIQISNRVVDAIDKFVTDNVDSMNNIKDILTTTRNSIANAKGSKISESAMQNSAQRQIASIKHNRHQNVFGAMMEQTAKAIMKDDDLRDAFMTEASLDIGKIKAYCTVSYTMLETANTTNMIHVNEGYIKRMIDSIV